MNLLLLFGLLQPRKEHSFFPGILRDVPILEPLRSVSFPYLLDRGAAPLPVLTSSQDGDCDLSSAASVQVTFHAGQTSTSGVVTPPQCVRGKRRFEQYPG